MLGHVLLLGTVELNMFMKNNSQLFFKWDKWPKSDGKAEFLQLLKVVSAITK